MTIQQQTINDILVLRPSGRLDSTNALEFERAVVDILDAGHSKLIFDFAELDYISSAGLRIILLAGKKMRTVKGNLALSNLRANVHEVFQMSGFQTIFNIYPSIQEAIQYIDATPNE